MFIGLSYFSLCFLAFFALKKQKDEQIATNAATIRRANVVFRPVSASPIESFMPRKYTLWSAGGAVVAVGKKSKVVDRSCKSKPLSEQVSGI